MQLGKHDSDQKDLGVFSPETTIRQAIAVIDACDFFVGFDGGLAHIATALNKPAIVVWDVVRKSQLEEAKHPGFSGAMMRRWSYPQNMNYLILEERNNEVVDLICQDISGGII